MATASSVSLAFSLTPSSHSARGIFLEHKSDPSPCLQPSSGFQNKIQISHSDPVVTVQLAPAGPSDAATSLPWSNTIPTDPLSQHLPKFWPQDPLIS